MDTRTFNDKVASVVDSLTMLKDAILDFQEDIERALREFSEELKRTPTTMPVSADLTGTPDVR